ncbi:hypothetical protein [Clostridium cavendishii]|uniref:hypothetical protein n=1 Tax=Clostridium cavendishii TaxID=349931 RepID=UPI0013566DC2|nr:hypothetical protein [Clostridium cavendishii]
MDNKIIYVDFTNRKKSTKTRFYFIKNIFYKIGTFFKSSNKSNTNLNSTRKIL